MHARTMTTAGKGGERGFALVLAILSLMLLTFLGLTLAATTSTELQIATNYRWSQQALYNAEAGAEVGKVVLASMDWSSILPPVRTTPWNGVTTPTAAGGGAVAPFARADALGEPSRNFDRWSCDTRGNGVGYGVVLDDGGTQGPYQNVSSQFNAPLNGSFTLWVRRPVVVKTDGTLEDYDDDTDNIVLVSEGIAPSIAVPGLNRAVRVIEVTLSRRTASNTRCGTRSGQTGGGPEGAGFAGCAAVTGGAVGAALGQGVTERDPNAQ